MSARTTRRRWPEGLRTALRLAPVLLVVMGLFGTGLLSALAESLTDTDTGAVTARYYRAVLQDDEFRASLALTLWVATASTAVATVAGVGIALLLSRLRAGRTLAYLLLQTPLAIPHLALAVALLMLIGPSGWIARVLSAAGLLSEPALLPALVYDRYGIGIILAYLAKEIPFIAVVTIALLARIGPEYERVAATLGASRWQRLWHVTVPMLAPGVVSAALMVFAFVFAAFETPFILGRPYPAMLSVVAERRYLSLDLHDRPDAIAWALLMTLLAAIVVRAYVTLSRAVWGRGRPVVF